jgi:hypothetical protein
MISLLFRVNNLASLNFNPKTQKVGGNEGLTG